MVLPAGEDAIMISLAIALTRAPFRPDLLFVPFLPFLEKTAVLCSGTMEPLCAN